MMTLVIRFPKNQQYEDFISKMNFLWVNNKNKIKRKNNKSELELGLNKFYSQNNSVIGIIKITFPKWYLKWDWSIYNPKSSI